jgi:hypothetical protein
MWLPNLIRQHRGWPLKDYRHIVHFHKKIQWAERPYGYYYEIFWFILVASLLLYAIFLQI